VLSDASKGLGGKINTVIECYYADTFSALCDILILIWLYYTRYGMLNIRLNEESIDHGIVGCGMFGQTLSICISIFGSEK
jgi:hypothetical protein